MILLQGHALALIYLTMFGVWLLGEVALLVTRRATVGLVPGDRGFVGSVLLVFMLTNLVAILALRFCPWATFATGPSACVGIGLMVLGLALRWWSVIHLGRFFTVNVAVSTDQRVIDSGPYRWIRHPSYAGMLLLLVGIGVCFGNVVSMAVILVPLVALLLKRIRVEEAALASTLGDTYRDYRSHTKRLIPAIY